MNVAVCMCNRIMVNTVRAGGIIKLTAENGVFK